MIKRNSNIKVLEAYISISLSRYESLISVSGEVYSLLGYSADDLLNGKVLFKDLIHSNDQDILDSLFAFTCTLIEGYENIRLRHANGRIVCVKVIYTKTPNVNQSNATLDLVLQDAKSLWQHQCDQTLMPNFKSMMENTDDYIYFKDRNHVFNGASQALVKITESIKNWPDFLGLTDYDVFLEHYADIYYALEKQVFSGVNVAQEIQETLFQDGRKGWVDNRKYPIRNDATGEIIGLFGIARDVTAQRYAEQALRESEELLRESQEIAKLGNYVLDVKNNTWQFSEGLDHLLGLDESYERTLASFLALIHSEDVGIIKSYLDIHVESLLECFDKEFRMISPADNAQHWVRGVGKFFKDDKGCLIKVRGTIQDIDTSHKDLILEKRAILSNKLVGIVTLFQRKITWANATFEKMLGYDAGELLGVPSRQFYITEEEYLNVGKVYEDLNQNDIGHTICRLQKKMVSIFGLIRVLYCLTKKPQSHFGHLLILQCVGKVKKVFVLLQQHLKLRKASW